MSGDNLTVELPLFHKGSGSSNLTSPHQLLFREINYQTAMRVVIEKHYLHRKAPTSYSFGAYFDNELLGVCTIGKPASHTLLKGVCGKEKAEDVFELNRLWLDDVCPKNSESRFLGWVLRQLPKGMVLVSYADTAYGHKGIIYRATNWISTGTSTPFTDYTFGAKDHRSIPKHLRDKTKMIKKTRSIKNRYVYFTDPKDRHLLKWAVDSHTEPTAKLRT